MPPLLLWTKSPHLCGDSFLYAASIILARTITAVTPGTNTLSRIEPGADPDRASARITETGNFEIIYVVLYIGLFLNSAKVFSCD